jgi:hypothetical protein
MTPPKRIRRRWPPSAVLAVASGASGADAAKLAGTSARTIDRWKAREDFKAEVERCRTRLLERAIGSASALAWEAIETLGAIMRDPENPPASRVSASARLLDNLLKSREASTLSERLDALEHALSVGQPQRPAMLTTAREVQR